MHKLRKTQPAPERIECKQRGQAEHVQVIDDAYRQIVNARMKTP